MRGKDKVATLQREVTKLTHSLEVMQAEKNNLEEENKKLVKLSSAAQKSLENYNRIGGLAKFN